MVPDVVAGGAGGTLATMRVWHLPGRRRSVPQLAVGKGVRLRVKLTLSPAMMVRRATFLFIINLPGLGMGGSGRCALPPRLSQTIYSGGWRGGRADPGPCSTAVGDECEVCSATTEVSWRKTVPPYAAEGSDQNGVNVFDKADLSVPLVRLARSTGADTRHAAGHQNDGRAEPLSFKCGRALERSPPSLLCHSFLAEWRLDSNQPAQSAVSVAPPPVDGAHGRTERSRADPGACCRTSRCTLIAIACSGIQCCGTRAAAGVWRPDSSGGSSLPCERGGLFRRACRHATNEPDEVLRMSVSCNATSAV